MITLLIALIDSLMILSWLAAAVLLGMLYIGFPYTLSFYEKVLNSVLDNNSNPYLALTSLALLLSVFFSLYLRRKRTLSSSDIYIKGSGSQEVKISNRAVTEFIFKIIDNIDGIHTANVKVLSNYNRNKAFVKIKVALFEGTSYPEINAELEDLIKVKLAEDMGIKNIASVNISLEKFVPKEEDDIYADEGLLTE